ncbi:Fc receptor-like protein 5 [Mastacembelus armatus]|uniref:Fc receptor-like protein 5 n=1 Tax=Mastacembelus armatus TaxID=205130 RepID=UPI000E461C6A|nr:Fc receptor-like protein 5 [Mastacembelus armatus]
MGHTLLCVLSLFLLNPLLYYGHAQEKPKAQLSADDTDIPAGGSVTLTCSVKPSSGWKYHWYRGDTSSEVLTGQDAVSHSPGQISVSQEGLYWCRGRRGDPVYYTEYSDSVTIYEYVPNRAVVTLQPSWSQLFRGETVTLRCEIMDGANTEWEYEWKTTNSLKPPTQHDYKIQPVLSSANGEYSCKGRSKGSQSLTKWSDATTLTVSDYKPKPVLNVSPSWLSPGASVTLNCEVEHPSAGWRFYWYKAVPKLSGDSYSYELLPGSSSGTEQDSYMVHGQTHTAGYVCKARRGDPLYYTLDSEMKLVWFGDAVLTLEPSWSTFFTGEFVSFICDMNEGKDTDWEYKINKDGQEFVQYNSHKKYTLQPLSTAYSGEYQCFGWQKSSKFIKHSNKVNLTVSDQPKPVLTVSPSWLSPGASLTLNCEVEHPSAGWRFYWYKAVPKLPGDSYSYELLPGSSSGTEQDSYMVHGQTHTAGYVCRAGRGDPVFYTQYSELKLVWSADAVLTLEPSWSTFFTGECVSFICHMNEGKDTDWEYKINKDGREFHQ